jgi:methanogenic corrinoid protein MtbC1
MPAATPRVALRQETTDRYLELIGAGDEPGSVALVLKLLDEGVSAEAVLLDVVATAQARVGQLWAEDLWSVAREHAATAISERAVAAVAARSATRPTRGRVTVACADGEWHALPVRITAEILRLRGWRVDFLGASVPGSHLVAHLHQTDADTVALSCMLPTRLPQAHTAITASQAVGVPVIAGGPGFGADGRHASLLGADAWAPRADAAADRLAADDWPPLVAATRARHLPGGEYGLLLARRSALIDAAIQRFVDVYPPLAGYDDPQRESTMEDLAQIIDFLAAALYVDDVTVFTDFAGWMTRVLAARGLPETALTTGLEICRELLPDHPRAQAMLACGVLEVNAAARPGQPRWWPPSLVNALGRGHL